MVKKSLFAGLILIFVLGLAGSLLMGPEQARADIAISGEVGDGTETTIILPSGDIAISNEVSNGTSGVPDEGSFTTISDDNGGGGGGGGGGGSRRSRAPARVLGTSTTCVYPYLTKYIKFGRANDPVEVMKLQRFLRDFQGYDVPLSGFYDETTMTAVMSFQRRYSADVLNPWGLTQEQPTGYVFITTTLVINRLYCGYTTKHDLDLRNVYRDYAAPLASLPRTGAGGVDLEVFGATTSSSTIATSTTQAAAVGFLQFLKDNLWFWLVPLLILILIIAGYYIWPESSEGDGPNYDDDDFAPPAGEDEIYGEDGESGK